MADKIAILNKGRLQQYATPDEVYSRPHNIFVAGFIGSPPMNFIECSLIESDNTYYLDAGAFKLSIERELAELIKKHATSSELILGIRPEHTKLFTEPRENTIPARVYVIEPLGAEIILDVRIDETIFKMRLNPLDVPKGLSHDQEIWIGVDFDKIHIFDKRTELAIL